MDCTVDPTEWKPQASTGKYRQVEAPLLCAVPAMHQLPASVVTVASFSGCLIAAAQHSGFDDFEIAEQMHISHGYMSRFMRGIAQQWAKRLVTFMRITRSLAPLQWMVEQMACDMAPRASQSARIRELEDELRKLTGRYAA